MTSQENRQSPSSYKTSRQVNFYINNKYLLILCKCLLLVVCFNILEKYSFLPLPTLTASWQLSVGDIFLFNAKIELK